MTDCTDARIVRCPYCKTPFCEQEGTLCDCLMEIQEVRAEMEWQRQEEEEEPDPDEPLRKYRYRRNIRGYK